MNEKTLRASLGIDRNEFWSKRYNIPSNIKKGLTNTGSEEEVLERSFFYSMSSLVVSFEARMIIL